MGNEQHPPISFCLANGMTNGGVTTWSLSLADRLSQRGIATRILSHTAGANHARFNTAARPDVVDCPGNAITQEISHIPGFLPCYSENPEGVFVPNWSWGTWAAVALLSLHQRSDIRVIGIAHSDDEHYYKVLSYYEPIISTFITVSTEINDRLVQMLPHRSTDIAKLFYPVAASVEPRHRHDHPELTIAYVGRVEQWQKRILDIKELTLYLSKSVGQYKIIVAGDGCCLAELQSHFEKVVYPNVSIRFLGLVEPEDVGNIWATADVSVLFSDYEGMSISMLESMGHGCVPVVTEVSGVQGTVRQGDTGFVVPVGDMESMAGWLQTLQADRDLLERLSTACRNHIRRFHQVEDYDNQFVSFVEHAWQTPSARWPADKPILPPPPARSEQPLFTPFYRRAINKFKQVLERTR